MGMGSNQLMDYDIFKQNVISIPTTIAPGMAISSAGPSNSRETQSFSSQSSMARHAVCVGCESSAAVKVHYGAPSCHGCKAFFRRSVFDNRVYKCRSQNNCDVEHESRNRCRACRFRKCLEGGMNPKQVREERTKRKESPAEKPTVRPSPEFLISEQEGCSAVSSSHHIVHVDSSRYENSNQLIQFLCALDRQIEQICDDVASSANYRNDVSVVTGLIDPRQVVKRSPIKWLWERVMTSEDLCGQFYRAFVMQADWAMGIPEYRVLSLSDQTALFKQNFATFGWITYAYRSYEYKMEKVGIPLGNESFIPYSEELRNTMEPKLRDTYGEIGKKLVNMIVNEMIELNMTNEEYCLIKVMGLFQTLDGALTDEGKQACKRMNSRLVRALSAFITQHYPHLTNEEKIERSTLITTLLSSLTYIGYLESNLIQNLSSSDLNQLSGVPLELLTMSK